MSTPLNITKTQKPPEPGFQLNKKAAPVRQRPFYWRLRSPLGPVLVASFIAPSWATCHHQRMVKLICSPRLVSLAALPLLSGCVANTLVSAATAPVRVAGKAVDAATTNQSESDERRDRDMRKREERLGHLERDYLRHRDQCDRGDDDSCDQAREDYRDIQALLPARSEYRY